MTGLWPTATSTPTLHSLHGWIWSLKSSSLGAWFSQFTQYNVLPLILMAWLASGPQPSPTPHCTLYMGEYDLLNYHFLRLDFHNLHNMMYHHGYWCHDWPLAHSHLHPHTALFTWVNMFFYISNSWSSKFTTNGMTGLLPAANSTPTLQLNMVNMVL